MTADKRLMVPKLACAFHGDTCLEEPRSLFYLQRLALLSRSDRLAVICKSM